MARKAFITGITGQDGSYLAEILLEKGYEVYGMIRRSSSFNTARIDHIFGDVKLEFGDLTDGSVLNQLMRTIRPDEVYNLGAQSHVQRELRRSGVHGGRRRTRDVAPARRHPRRGCPLPLLPGVVERDVRPGARGPRRTRRRRSIRAARTA